MSDTEQPEGEASADWRRDSIWHYRSWVLALVGIIITVVFFLYEDSHRPVKSLTYDLVAVGPLVSVEDDMNKRVKVIFDGKAVTNVKFAVVTINNPSNVPISKADFERPLSLHFGSPGTSNILTAQLLNSHPNNLGAAYKIKGDTLLLDPLLLNPEDNITLKVIYTGGGEKVNIDARIVGVSEVKGIDPSEKDKVDTVQGIQYTVLLIAVALLVAILFINAHQRRFERRLVRDPVFARSFLAMGKKFNKRLVLQTKKLPFFKTPYAGGLANEGPASVLEAGPSYVRRRERQSRKRRIPSP